MRKLIHIAVLTALTALGIVVAATPAQAAATSYVALGDSYASGTGTEDYFDEDCLRSNVAYSELIAQEQGYDLDLAACSGAVIDDVTNNQLSHLSDSTGLVTMSIGGNDAGFTSVITSCAKPWPWTCWGDIDDAEAFINNDLPGKLDSLYTSISEAAPNAHVIIIGYPRLFNGESCNVITRISAEEQERLNGTADLLASTTATVAGNHGFDFVDAIPGFSGHAVCDDEEWLNGLSSPIVESYHPNALGHQEFAREITPLL